MKIFIDESGDFDFSSSNEVKYALVGSLIVPESKENILSEFINVFSDNSPDNEKVNGEIKGSLLSDDNRFRFCKFMSRNSCFKITIFITDNKITTDKIVALDRKEQVKRFEINKAQYIQAGGKAPKILAHLEKIIKICKNASRMSNNEYIEQRLISKLLKITLEKTTLCYMATSYKNDLGDFHFIIDRKLINKLSPMEKFLFENIKLMLGFPKNADPKKYDLSKKMGMTTYEGWTKDNHPFVAKYCLEDAIDLNILFEHGLEFRDSSVEAGLKTIDIICNTIFRALKHPEDKKIMKCYDLISNNLIFNNSRDKNLINVAVFITSPEAESKKTKYRYYPFWTLLNIRKYRLAGYKLTPEENIDFI